jgi:hypothetical protein
VLSDVMHRGGSSDNKWRAPEEIEETDKWARMSFKFKNEAHSALNLIRCKSYLPNFVVGSFSDSIWNLNENFWNKWLLKYFWKFLKLGPNFFITPSFI